MRLVVALVAGLTVLGIAGCGGSGGGGSTTPPPTPVEQGPTISLRPGTIRTSTATATVPLGVTSARPATVAWTVVSGDSAAIRVLAPAVDGTTVFRFTTNGTWVADAVVSDSMGRQDQRRYTIEVSAPVGPALSGTVYEGVGTVEPRAGVPVVLTWEIVAGQRSPVASATTGADGRWSFPGTIIPSSEIQVVIDP